MWLVCTSNKSLRKNNLLYFVEFCYLAAEPQVFKYCPTYLLSLYRTPSTVLGTDDATVDQTDKNAWPLRAYVLGQGDR